jgi:hypothetical protein
VIVTLEEYRRRFNSDDSPGWDAIESLMASIYPNQEPLHWSPRIRAAFGGPDPLDGISAYACSDGGRPHHHFVTYGYSVLDYEEEVFEGDKAEGPVNGFGFEMSFRLARIAGESEDDLIWVCHTLQTLARYVFESGRIFQPYHWIQSTAPGATLRDGYPTDLVGLAFLVDPVLGTLATPHGPVTFIQAFGLTRSELRTFENTRETAEKLIESHRPANPLLITDLNRRDPGPGLVQRVARLFGR